MLEMLGKLKTRYQQSRGLRVLAEVLLVLAVISAIGAFQTRNHPRGALPSLTLQTLDDRPATLENYRGKPLLLVVWAPWCGVCKLESSNVSRVRDWLGERANVVSIAAAYRDLADVTRYVQEQGVAYPVLLASDAEARKLKIGAFPTFFVVDARGRIVSSMQGYTTTLGLFLRVLWAGV